jgi:hypothetical protein
MRYLQEKRRSRTMLQSVHGPRNTRYVSLALKHLTKKTPPLDVLNLRRSRQVPTFIERMHSVQTFSYLAVLRGLTAMFASPATYSADMARTTRNDGRRDHEVCHPFRTSQSWPSKSGLRVLLLCRAGFEPHQTAVCTYIALEQLRKESTSRRKGLGNLNSVRIRAMSGAYKGRLASTVFSRAQDEGPLDSSCSSSVHLSCSCRHPRQDLRCQPRIMVLLITTYIAVY